jgi:hypothetical protein
MFKVREKSSSNVEKAFREMFKKALEETFPADVLPDRHLELHPSSFPYCALQHAHQKFTGAHESAREEFGLSYYAGIGTTVHSVLQRYLGATGKMIGKWKCVNKKCKHVHKEHPKNGQCIKCKSPAIYKEIGGRHGKHIHWHTDGIVKIGKYHFLIDFKTTSSYQVYLHTKQNKKVFPHKSHEFQIRSYIVMAEKKLGIKLDGWILVYGSRDHFQRDLVVVPRLLPDNFRKQVSKQLDIWDQQFGKVLKMKGLSSLPKAIEMKACVDKKFYEEFYHSPWEPCPIHKVCFKGEEKIIKFFKREIAKK